MRNFWLYETDLPPGSATPNFGPQHWTWLGLVLLAIVVLAWIFARLSSQGRRRLIISLASLLAGGELARLVWVTATGHFSVVDDLPLHLSNLAVFIELAALGRKRVLLKEFSYACCLPSALAALLTPAWGAYPVIHFAYLESVISHTILILLPILWIVGRSFRPESRRLPACFALLAWLALLAVVVNLMIGSNYMFLREPPAGTPLAVFARWCGNPGYIVPLIGLVLVVWLVLYLPWAIKSRRDLGQPPPAWRQHN
jgi:hypothetical integral membrane protein (TIGR02206 family)